MKDKIYTIEYLQELQKLKDSLERLEQKIDRHLNKVLGGLEDDTVLMNRKQAAEYLGISTRQFDRKAKAMRYWRYRNMDGTGLRYNLAEFSLSKDELKDKWVKGILSKQIDDNCNVIKKIDTTLLQCKNKRLLQKVIKNA